VKKLGMICMLLMVGLKVSAQEMQWQGVSFDQPATVVATQLEALFGTSGTWDDTHTYRIMATFLGTPAVLELHSINNRVRSATFSFEEALDLRSSRSYWMSMLGDLFGQHRSTDVLSGQHEWQLRDATVIRWRQATETQSAKDEATSISGTLHAKGSSKRLYSIDGEEYEETSTIELEDVQIGKDKEIQVHRTKHWITFSFVVIEPSEDELGEGQEEAKEGAE
jgi:hypothetical protein